MKVRRACHQCRTRKKSCHRLETGVACSRCLKAQVQCSYATKLQTQQRLQPTTVCRPGSTPPVSVISLPHQVARILVEYYLHYIHDRPHSLFHRPTLRRQAEDQSLNTAVLYAICSYGSHFHKDPEIQCLGPQLTAEAKRLLNADIENVCLENIQACVLVANLSASELNSTSEAVYSGIANRFAYLLRINTRDPSDPVVLNEIKVRVWWTLHMTDHWCSMRLGLPRQIRNFEGMRELPMDEEVFHNLHHEQNFLPTAWRPGLWAHMITLVKAFGPIQDLNLRLAQEDLTLAELDSLVRQLSQQLNSWKEQLPADVKLTEANLEAHRRKGLGGEFVALHLGYHHYTTLLYFQYLDYSGSVDSERYAELCKTHAAGCSTLLRLARESEGCAAVYATVGQMAMVSSAALLHTLLFGDDDELVAARSNLSSNFESMMELKKIWPRSLDRTVGAAGLDIVHAYETQIERLFTFQSICLVSANEQSTHKIDKWMVRFLLEHSLPLPEKAPIVGLSPTSTEFALLSSTEQRFTERGRLTNNVLSGLLD